MARNKKGKYHEHNKYLYASTSFHSYVNAVNAKKDAKKTRQIAESQEASIRPQWLSTRMYVCWC